MAEPNILSRSWPRGVNRPARTADVQPRLVYVFPKSGLTADGDGMESIVFALLVLECHALSCLIRRTALHCTVTIVNLLIIIQYRLQRF